MSKHLTVAQTIELLERLKAIVREFAASEERTNREFRSKTEAAKKRFEEDAAGQEKQLAESLAAAEGQFTTSQQSRSALIARRAEAIARAHKSSQKLALERIEREEGKGKYQSQKGLLDTKRWRTDSLAQNDATLAEFQGQLEANRAEFAALEAEATRAFRGYGKFGRALARTESNTTEFAGDEHGLLDELRKLHARTADDLALFRKRLLPIIFATMPLWLWVMLIAAVAAAAVPMLPRVTDFSLTYPQAAIAGGVLSLLLLVAYFAGLSGTRPLAMSIASHFATARRLHALASEKAHARHAAEIERIEVEAKQRTDSFNETWQHAMSWAAEARSIWPARIEEKFHRVRSRHEQKGTARIAALEQAHGARVEKLRTDAALRRDELKSRHQAALARFEAEFQAQWQTMQRDWRQLVEPIEKSIREASAAANEGFAPWQPELWRDWRPPQSFQNAAKFATLEVDVRKFAEAAPTDPRLPFPAQLALPLTLVYPEQGSILFETTRTGNEPVFAALNNIIFRLLAGTPAGKLSFTIIDPVGLGQNFSTVMHLADFEDNVINGRIWTQSQQIDERLGELNEHMEKVIQMYLRNEYPTIADYNREAGNIAEKYHFVVVADFPANFTQGAVQKLQRIAASGARCGVFTLIHWDHRQTAPPDFLPEELRKSSVCVSAAGEQFILAHPFIGGSKVVLEAPPAPEFATQFLQTVGETSRGSNRVEVPFAQVAPGAENVWSLDTTEELRVPIGRSGATKLQYLAIGKGTRQHALIAGKTGSGKSTLFHVLVTNLALWASPEQVEFYLIDFKKGVEFKAYATQRLPHARVIAIESDREFGLSVLQRLDEELRRRGELFRQLGVQDVPGYKRAGGKEPMPRTLLLIDEFQEFFVEDDRIAQAANLLLDRIVRQGRAFGIHVILGSQTLGGAYTLARTTIGQMVIRIALQCNEADAYLIMDENNAAPRLLSRPGEGIYNDMAGAVEGNSPFQAVWLDDVEREALLKRVRAAADARGTSERAPIVFEGNAPADVRDNAELRRGLAADVTATPANVRMWLGAPNSIKGPTAAVFQNRSGNNLLFVGQREEPLLAMLSVGLISLAAQFPPDAARFIVFESTAPGSPERALLEQVVGATPHGITLAKVSDLPATLNGLNEELTRRAEGQSGPVTFLFVHGTQNFKKLRAEDDFSFGGSDEGASPATQFQKLITEGPAHGIHVIATFDTYNNVNRFFGRKLLSEFEMRVLFQMSANDSASLCDDPKASALGLHRALLYNEQEGFLETFRPYAMPAREWMAEASKALGKRS